MPDHSLLREPTAEERAAAEATVRTALGPTWWPGWNWHGPFLCGRNSAGNRQVTLIWRSDGQWGWEVDPDDHYSQEGLEPTLADALAVMQAALARRLEGD